MNELHESDSPKFIGDLDLGQDKVSALLVETAREISDKKQKLIQERCLEKGIEIDFDLPPEQVGPNFYSTSEQKGMDRYITIFHTSGAHIITFIESNEIDLDNMKSHYTLSYF